jgi:hypothetical protein
MLKTVKGLLVDVYVIYEDKKLLTMSVVYLELVFSSFAHMWHRPSNFSDFRDFIDLISFAQDDVSIVILLPKFEREREREQGLDPET